MLGKLIKHDFKASYKLMFIAHAFIIILSSIVGGALWIQSITSNGETTGMTMSVITIYVVLLYVAMTAISVFATQIYVGVRFYKNLFTDEGYLMHTLPVSSTQLLHSKLITGAAWIIFNIVIVGISALLIYFPLITQILNVEGMFVSGLETLSLPDVLGNAFVSLLGMMASLFLIYGCICLGQLFHKNRIMAAIIAFLGSKVVLGIVSAILNLTFLFSNNTSASAFFFTYGTTTGDSVYTSNTLSYSNIIVSLLTIGVFYFISHYIMNKKVNLV